MFSIGQDLIKQRLLRDIAAQRVPHALMFTGPEGAGKMAIALDLAQALLCEQPMADMAPCGSCTSCRMVAKLEHPDLHFSFPIVRTARIKDAKDAISDHCISEWRQRLLQSPYFDINDWIADMAADNQQATYYVAEAQNIQRKLALKSNRGGRKVMIIWLPEKMNAETANALLKIFEEPPADTHFIMVSQQPELVLPTILSRTQQIRLPQLSPEEYLKAHQPKDEDNLNELFVSLMRLAYQRRVKDLREWADNLAAMGREPQKQFLQYCQRMLRENFIYNFHLPQLNNLTPSQQAFSKNFARFINERNVIPFTEAFSKAEDDITHNVNPKMVFFDLALKVIVLLIK